MPSDEDTNRFASSGGGPGSRRPRVLISYRRTDTRGYAGWIYQWLCGRFGKPNVFKDIDAIRLGQNWRKVIESEVSRCDALIALVGQRWLEASDDRGRRLDDEGDVLRIEIQHALDRDIPVIPVLVEGAEMPSAEVLPESLRPFVDRQALQLSELHFEQDMEALARDIEAAVAEVGAREAQLQVMDEPRNVEPKRARQRDLLPIDYAPAPPAEAKPARLPRRLWRPAAIAVAAVLVAIPILALALWRSGSLSEWVALPGLPVALEGAAVVPYDGRVWVIGGISAGEGRPILDRVDIYDPGTRTWRPGPSIPEPLYYAAVASTGTQLYLLGGLSSLGAVNTVYRLDNPTAKWQLHGHLPAARGAGSAAWDGHRLVFGGGVGTDHRAADEVWALENRVWRLLGHLNPAREKLASATDQNGTVWFLGGRDPNAAATAYPAVDVAKAQSVTPGGQVSAVQGAAAVWWPSLGVCMIGGQGANGFSGRVECLDTESEIPSLPSPRAGLGAAVLGGRVFIAGGYDAGHHGSRTLEGFANDLADR